MKTQPKELTLALAHIRRCSLAHIRRWFDYESKDVLPYLREIRKPIRLSHNRYLAALRINGDDIEFAFIGRGQRTYNPHKEGCWTSSANITSQELKNIENKLYRPFIEEAVHDIISLLIDKKIRHAY